MSSRTDLQSVLENILGSDYVYYQPPESLKLHYPCIVYERDDIYKLNADDNLYNRTIKYQVTLIDANPDSLLIDKLIALQKCRFVRHFTADNLNHDIFELYY